MLAQQRVEYAPVLVLVRAVPGDLGRQVLVRLGHQGRDPAVLPAALGLVAGRDGAEQPERLVVVEDLRKDRLGRQHSSPLLLLAVPALHVLGVRAQVGAWLEVAVVEVQV